jgi:hypothetical protein
MADIYMMRDLVMKRESNFSQDMGKSVLVIFLVPQWGTY